MAVPVLKMDTGRLRKTGMSNKPNSGEGGSQEVQERPLILLTGATGYVGGRMLTRLEDAGYLVRCLTRRPEELEPRIKPGTDAIFADMLDPGSLDEAMRGGDIAFYLVHSMGSAKG